MVQIDFHGGVEEIGGNKIHVRGVKNSFFLDFGKSFNSEGDYFSEFLQPRKLNGIMDLVEFGLLPKIKGLYREDYIRHLGLNHHQKPSSDGILISHAHLDHVGYLHHIRDDIPFYMSEESYLIIKALEETGMAGFNNYLNYADDFLYLAKTRLNKNSKTTHKKATAKDTKKSRPIEIVEPYKDFEIGEFIIKSAPVDHSLPGSCAFLVDNGEESLVYTGDFRFHGKREYETKKFIKEAKKFAPTTLITEGTRIDRDHNTTEEEIEKKARELSLSHKGLIIVNYPIRDLDRFLTFYEAARDSDRTMVVNTKQAFLLNAFSGRGYPEIDDVAVYVPRRTWGLMGGESQVCFDEEWVCSSEIDREYILGDYKGWEKDYITWENNVNYLDLQERPEDYMFQCDYFEFKELIDIQPENAIYIKSKTEPFNDEMEIDGRRERNWLNHFGIEVHTGYHASGHACGPEIRDMIRDISPEKVYPIHTREVGAFDVLKEEGIEVFHPELK
ncbi:MAG: MBL fold metallo-hydrolase RNA specificity domain-containing protein [Methanobacteriaceae archaeon]|nr:MBL fold metallo-hydrolase RNA specificity domain-containing protein [Methanobacteriaceae archaeon]MDO9626119.1 MBL fold metallo-hydrolase RNA specificity domain-containing protein [Methanobacteriaceae archaeon]